MPGVTNPIKVAATSLLNTDKLPMYSITTEGSGNGIGGGASITAVAPASPAVAQVTTAKIPNPYKKKCRMTLSWSLDGVTFYPMNQPVFYYNGTFASYFYRALAFGGCSDSFIYLGVTSQYTGPQTIYFQFALGSPT